MNNDTTNQIRCPYCQMRLFDIINNAKGQIEIKCGRCRKIVKIELDEADIEKDFAEFMRQLQSVAV